MSTSRETGPEEQEVILQLYNLLEPPVVGARFQDGDDKVLLYAAVPMKGLPSGIVAVAAHWLYQALGGGGDLGHLIILLSRALNQWLTERSKGVPIVA